jgi:hypothetical protein
MNGLSPLISDLITNPISYYYYFFLISKFDEAEREAALLSCWMNSEQGIGQSTNL